MHSVVIPHFDLGQIAGSGQCFRMREVEKGVYRVFNYREELVVRQEGNLFHFMCSTEDFEKIWKPYFDLGTDYDKLDNLIDDNDVLLSNAKEYGRGIRILNQDFWETCVSFVISQNNNIPRIRIIIERLCSACGGLFPSREDLLNTDLSDMGLGYREEYLYELAQYLPCEEEFDKLSYREAKEVLKRIKGIGDKVADCICLFGLHKLEACPMDVWMKRIICDDYNGIAPEWVYSEYAGYYQQLAFYYKRSLGR